MLTDTECKNATSEGLRIRKLADGQGLYLWVYEDGRKYWRIRYWQAGKEKSLSLGVYPAIGLKAARKRRDTEREHLNNNLDPSAERRADRVRRNLASANSFEDVAREWLAQYGENWVEAHTRDVTRRLEKNLFPDLGRRPISEIDAPELLLSVRKIEDRGARDLAHRVMGVAGQVFRYGVGTGRCIRDITGDIKGVLKTHVAKNQPSVIPEDLPKLLRAIDSYEDCDRQTQLALMLMTLTFTRTAELVCAQWDPEFDLKGAMWTVPPLRMKLSVEKKKDPKNSHFVPLARQSLEILKELKAIGGGSRFVFPGRNRDKPMSNNTMLFALYRLGYKGKMSGHGFRAVASTILNESGKFRSDVIEAQLAHQEENEVRDAYNHAEYLPERIKMMRWWADHVDAMRAGGKVIPMKRTAAS